MSRLADSIAGQTEQRLWGRFLLIAGAMLIVLFVAAAVVMVTALNRVNELERTTGLRVLNSALNGQLESLARTGLDHAFWDDMVEQAENGFDPDWVENNVGLFIHETTDISLTLVVNAADEPTLFVADGEHRDPSDMHSVNEVFAAFNDRVRAGAVDPPEPITGFQDFGDQVYLISATPITDEYPAEDYDRGARSILFFGRALTDEFLAELAADFNLPGLRCEKTEPQTPYVTLSDLAGTPTVWLTWTPVQPGNAWLRIILPVIALCFVIFTVLGVALTQTWRVTLDRVSQQEANVVAAMEDAIAANRTKSAFLANMSHELRTPLNAVIGFSNILRSEMFGPVGSPKYVEYVNDIHSTSLHLLEMIDAILDVSKVESGLDSLEETACLVASVVQDAVRLIEPTYEDVHIVETVVPPDLSVFADRTKLVQILTNLLSNGAKASRPGQSIWVDAARTPEGGFRLTIKDQGPGIPKHIMRTLFQPFQRSGDPYRHDKSGIGLGLVISLRLAELHGGGVTLDSVEGAGTTATLTLPADRVLADETAAQAS